MNKKRKIAYGIIIGVLSILLLLTCYLLYYFFSMRDISITKEYIKVADNSSIDYTIKLKDNDYISDSSKVTNYVVDMIDYMNINYNYKTVFSDEVKGKVTIDTTATLVGNDKTTKETTIYNEFVESNPTSYEVDGGVISVSDIYKLDFATENKLFESFKEVNNLDLSGYVKYEVTVNYEVYSELISEYLKETTKLYVLVPLDGDTTQIEVSNPVEETTVHYAKMPEEQKPLYLVICLELFGAVVLFIILLIIVIKQMKDTSSKYEKELDKILTKYKKRIVKLRTIPDLSDKNVVLVKSFNDLNNVSKIKNINYVEIIDNKLSIFFINDNGTTYVYNFDAKKVNK